MKQNRKSNHYDMSADLKFKISESYKTIRTNIAFSIVKKGCKKIVISSSEPGEGKSTISVNVAISIAKAGSKVLLLDADLRSPKIHLFFDLQGMPGITNHLSGANSIEEILHDTDYPNLKIITAGSISPNPSEMLTSELFSEMLQSLETQFDYIIIDSAPLNLVSDPLPIIKLCDGVILVIRKNVSTYTALENTLHALELIQAKVIGCIFNGKTYPKRRLRMSSSYPKP